MQSKNNRFQVYVDIKEYIHVAELIISNNSHSHIKALSYLQIWCERKPENKIPRSAYITYCLLNAFYKERNSMALSFALSKFISSECKEEEDKNNFNYKIPIYSTAKNIRLPAYMIKLRHDIIHGDDVVPYEQLIEAYNDAIEWLFINFWNPQLEYIKGIYSSVDQISEILDEYVLLMEKENLKEINDNYFKKINSIFDGISINDFIKVLLTDKYLFNKQYDNCDDTKKISFEFWFPMIEFFDESNQIDTLIESVLDALGSTQSDISSVDIIRKWSLYLLEACTAKRKVKKNRLKISLNPINTKNINWPNVLCRFIKQSLYKENMDILRKLISVHQPAIPIEKQEKIRSILDLICSNEFNDVDFTMKTTKQSFSF